MNDKDKIKLLQAIAFYALAVMTEIEQDGVDAIPHLIDLDDNPGQHLRTLLVEYGKTLDGTIYDFLSEGKQIKGGGYTGVKELLNLPNMTRRKP